MWIIKEPRKTTKIRIIGWLGPDLGRKEHSGKSTLELGVLMFPRKTRDTSSFNFLLNPF